MAEVLKEYIVDGPAFIGSGARESFIHTVELDTTAKVADIQAGAVALAEDLLTFEPPVVISPDDVEVELTPGVDHEMVLTYRRSLINMPHDATPGERNRYRGEPSVQQDLIKVVPEDYKKFDENAERAWRNAPAPIPPLLGAALGLVPEDRRF